MASRSRSPQRSVSRGRSYTRSPPPDPRARSRSPLRRSVSPRPSSPRGRRNNGPRRARSDSQSPVRSTKIVVERLTKNVHEQHLREIFGAFGLIRDVNLPTNKQFMTNRGTAYILYDSVADAESAIAYMHEAQLDGAVIGVSIVLPRRRFSVSPPPSHRVTAFEDRESQRRALTSPHRDRSPPSGPRGRFAYGRGGGASPRGRGSYGGDARRRSYSRSRSPYRSRSYSSRSRSFSRSPPPGAGRYRRRSPSSPPPPPPSMGGPGGRRGGDGPRRRSPSYDDRRDRSYSRERSPPPPRR